MRFTIHKNSGIHSDLPKNERKHMTKQHQRVQKMHRNKLSSGFPFLGNGTQNRHPYCGDIHFKENSLYEVVHIKKLFIVEDFTVSYYLS